MAGPASYQEDIKKSRFLVHAGPADSTQQAMRFFADNANLEATHNCWAYRIGDEYRFNDDGEPGGTAGRPILQAIDGQQCDHVAVLVIRWFGGIKLGSGGLIRAYGGTAAQCLRLANRTERIDEISLDCECVYSDIAIVQSRLAIFQAHIQQEHFNSVGVCWTLKMPRDQADSFIASFINLTRGQGVWGYTEQPKD